MKCPKCQGEMEKGAISTAGESDVMWYSQKSILKSILGHTLIAWSCLECGFVEMSVEKMK